MATPANNRLHSVSDLVLVLCFAGAIAWYLWDTIDASSRIGNLIFILPASVLGLLLCLIVGGGVVKQLIRPAPASDAATPGDTDGWARWRPGAIAGLFVVYILSLERLGFDLASFLFLALSLRLQGERNLFLVLGYSLVFAASVTYGFRWLMPYPMETFIIP